MFIFTKIFALVPIHNACGSIIWKGLLFQINRVLLSCNDEDFDMLALWLHYVVSVKGFFIHLGLALCIFETILFGQPVLFVDRDSHYLRSHCSM